MNSAAEKVLVFIGVIILFSFISVAKTEAATTLTAGVTDHYDTLLKSWNYEPYKPNIAWYVTLYDETALSQDPTATVNVTVECGDGQTHPLSWSGQLSFNSEGYLRQGRSRYVYGAYAPAGDLSFVDSGCTYHSQDGNLSNLYTYKAYGTATITGGGLNFTSPVNTQIAVYVRGLYGGIAMAGPITGNAPLTTDMKAAAYYSNPQTSTYYNAAQAEFNFDCTADGTYELRASGKGIYTASKLCTYSQPGYYKAKVSGRYNVGGQWRNAGDEINVVVFPQGETTAKVTPTDSKIAIASGGGIQFKTDVNNFLYSRVEYSFDCDGAGADHSATINADFTKNNDTHSHTCSYPTPGSYQAKVNVNVVGLNVSARGQFIDCYYSCSNIINRYNSKNIDLPDKSFTFDKTIYVTGKVSNDSYVVTTSFDLRWDASRAASCSVTGVGNNFSSSGSGAGSASINTEPGDYQYKLKCLGRSGVSVEKIISVKVFKP